MSESFEQTLGQEPGSLPVLEALSEADVARLQTLFEQAREAQHQKVEEAIESGLQIVPALLRKTVRKIFGDV